VNDTSLFTRLAMICSWYFADAEAELLVPAIRAAKRLFTRGLGRLTEGELFLLFDALGSYPQRDAALDGLYDVIHAQWGEKPK
jgi:hypothetical protein